MFVSSSSRITELYHKLCLTIKEEILFCKEVSDYSSDCIQTWFAILAWYEFGPCSPFHLKVLSYL